MMYIAAYCKKNDDRRTVYIIGWYWLRTYL